MEKPTTSAGNTNEPVLYAVFRSGKRVSESLYDSRHSAKAEYDYWLGILRRWPDGTKMDILPANHYRNKYQQT